MAASTHSLANGRLGARGPSQAPRARARAAISASFQSSIQSHKTLTSFSLYMPLRLQIPDPRPGRGRERGLDRPSELGASAAQPARLVLRANGPSRESRRCPQRGLGYYQRPGRRRRRRRRGSRGCWRWRRSTLFFRHRQALSRAPPSRIERQEQQRCLVLPAGRGGQEGVERHRQQQQQALRGTQPRPRQQ